MTAETAARVLAAAESAGRVLAMNNRFRPDVQALNAAAGGSWARSWPRAPG
jgi:predicted dehydrogenase